MEPLTITCPRCNTETLVDYYGPCEGCRAELKATLGSEGHELSPAEYEPKVNVTPNAVATNDG